MKVLAFAVTAGWTCCPAIAAASPGEVFLSAELTGFTATGTICVALPIARDDSGWRAQLHRQGHTIEVLLLRPDETHAAHKTIELGERESDCRAATELLAILLAAHVPSIAPALSPPPQRSPVPIASPKRTLRGPPRSDWRLSVGMGLGLEPAKYSVAAQALVLQFQPAIFGVEAKGHTSDFDLNSARGGVYVLSTAIVSGYEFSFEPLDLLLAGMTGVEITRASLRGPGVRTNGSATLVGLHVGARAEVVWHFSQWLLTVGGAVGGSLPPAAFHVAPVGEVHKTPRVRSEIGVRIGREF